MASFHLIYSLQFGKAEIKSGWTTWGAHSRIPAGNLTVVAAVNL